MAAQPLALAKQLLSILATDRPVLEEIDRYKRGKHDDPYMPAGATDEYRLLARRAIENWTPLVIATSCQALYVDSFRRGAGSPSSDEAHGSLPEWDHWQRSGLDARQSAIYDGAVTFGHSFTLTEKTKKGVFSRGLSALRTSALFEDPANDIVPFAALTVTAFPKSGETPVPGKARMWDSTFEYAVTFLGLDDEKSVHIVGTPKRHGSSECPITRFAASVDLEGRTTGVVLPMKALQDRLNQTIFDLLVAQTYASTKVRWVTGMAPPIRRDEDGDPILDASGNPIPLPINHNASRFLFAEDEGTKFGTMDETPLGGFIESIDMSIRHLAAITQTPPHHLLGQIANLSAEALEAAEVSLSRKVEGYRKSFGESWERVFRLAAELAGNDVSADDWHGEVVWRDMESRSLAQAADALGKMREQLGIPAKGLWRRVPQVTQNEIEEWMQLAEDEDPQGLLASAISRATPDTLSRPSADQPVPVQK